MRNLQQNRPSRPFSLVSRQTPSPLFYSEHYREESQNLISMDVIKSTATVSMRKAEKMVENFFSQPEDNYNLSDPCITLYDISSFQEGVHFAARHIGTVQITLPLDENDAIFSMRKVRMQFRRRYMRKKEVVLQINRRGLKLSLQGNETPHFDGVSIADVVMDDITFDKIQYILYDKFDRLVLCYVFRLKEDQYRLTLLKMSSRFLVCKVVKNIQFSYENFTSDPSLIDEIETTNKIKQEKQQADEEQKLLGKIKSKRRANQELKSEISLIRAQLSKQREEREAVEAEIDKILRNTENLSQNLLKTELTTQNEHDPEKPQTQHFELFSSKSGVCSQDFASIWPASPESDFTPVPTPGPKEVNTGFSPSFFDASSNQYNSSPNSRDYWFGNL